MVVQSFEFDQTSHRLHSIIHKNVLQFHHWKLPGFLRLFYATQATQSEPHKDWDFEKWSERWVLPPLNPTWQIGELLMFHVRIEIGGSHLSNLTLTFAWETALPTCFLDGSPVPELSND